MKISFEQYVLNNISEKTIVISCKDSYFINSFIENPNIILCTFFGNILQSPKGIDLEYFKYCITDEEAENILVIGHYRCDSLQFLQKSKPRNVVWKEAEKHLNNLDNNPFKRINSSNHYKQMVWLNTIQQILKISEMDFFKREKINIKGLIIDEIKNYSVSEINLKTIL